jgi:hypothetical protein
VWDANKPNRRRPTRRRQLSRLLLGLLSRLVRLLRRLSGLPRLWSRLSRLPGLSRLLSRLSGLPRLLSRTPRLSRLLSRLSGLPRLLSRLSGLSRLLRWLVRLFGCRHLRSPPSSLAALRGVGQVPEHPRPKRAATIVAAIADGLNASGVPTAQGGRRWCQATVRYTLRRSGKGW